MNNFRSQLTSQKRKDQELEARMERGWEERNQETSPNVLSLKKNKRNPFSLCFGRPSLSHHGGMGFPFSLHKVLGQAKPPFGPFHTHTCRHTCFLDVAMFFCCFPCKVTQYNYICEFIRLNPKNYETCAKVMSPDQISQFFGFRKRFSDLKLELIKS